MQHPSFTITLYEWRCKSGFSVSTFWVIYSSSWWKKTKFSIRTTFSFAYLDRCWKILFKSLNAINRRNPFIGQQHFPVSLCFKCNWYNLSTNIVDVSASLVVNIGEGTSRILFFPFEVILFGSVSIPKCVSFMTIENLVLVVGTSLYEQTS